MPASHHSFFTGQMPFLPPNQQYQSTEGMSPKYYYYYYYYYYYNPLDCVQNYLGEPVPER